MKTLNLINTKFQVYRQQGVVLIVSLVFLIALTAVAAALMQNTTTDIKMAGASQEKSIVTQETISETERVIFNQYRKEAGPSMFSQTITAPVALAVNQPDGAPLMPGGGDAVTGVASNVNQFSFVASCPRALLGTSSSEVDCTYTRIQVTRMYGRDFNHSIQVNSSVAQELKGSGN